MPHKEDDEDESDHVVVVDASDSSDAAEAISRIIVSHAEAVHNDGALELWQEIAPIIARLQPRDPWQSARPQGALLHTVAHPEPPVVTTGEAVDELIHQHTADTASTAEVLIQQQYIKIHQNTSKYISNTSVSVTTHVVSYTVWIHQSVQQYSHT